MTVLPRGPRSRRGGRGPGWLLLTALLVLAILASSTLVFTDRVELLRLAVVLSLWAAVMGAFVTVVYRRQSDLDQARARDMKFVYDLQLDREISARREYELSVEAHLRRQLARELRAQAADEMAGLRTELVSLRSHLEVLLGTDLGARPALENDRVVMPMPAAPGRVQSSRVTEITEEVVEFAFEIEAVENPIIDVPEEPLTPPVEPPYQAGDYRGFHRRPTDRAAAPQPQPPPPFLFSSSSLPPRSPQPEAPWRPPEVRRGRHWTGGDARPPEPQRLPEPPQPATEPARPPARHSVAPADQPDPAGRHRGPGEPVLEEPVLEEPVLEEPVVEEPQGQHTGGQSVSDLMARLQVSGSPGGGGRRRRED